MSNGLVKKNISGQVKWNLLFLKILTKILNSIIVIVCDGNLMQKFHSLQQVAVKQKLISFCLAVVKNPNSFGENKHLAKISILKILK